jgi:hypothetical protein
MLPDNVNNNIEYFESTNNMFLEYKIASSKNNDIVLCTSLVKKLYDDCLYHNSSKEVIKLIKNRKTVFSNDGFLTNDRCINEYYVFDQQLISEYKQQAKSNIDTLISNVKISNNDLKTILSYNESYKRFLYVTQILLDYSEDYPLFILESSIVCISVKLNKIKQSDASTKQLIDLFHELIRHIGIEESELLKMFYQTIELRISNNNDSAIDLLDFLAIALYWIFNLTKRARVPLRDIDCILDPLILLTIKDLGYSPWVFFAIDDIEFSQVCKMNRLLTQCIDIHFYRMHSAILAKMFIEKSNTIVDSYLYFFLARIMPLFWKNKNNKQASVEILPHALLLATYKVLPEIIAEAILQEVTDDKPDFIFDRTTLFIGEEFEFRDLQDKYFLFNNEYLVLESWVQKAKQEFNSKGITNYYITNSPVYKVAISIGDWEYSLFKDGENLEINTTPYRNKDVFTIVKNNKEIQYSAYQAFDEFIHPLIKFFGYTGMSGHKHIDARSLKGNTELLLRLIIDYENNSWLPVAINRLERCSNYFPYLTDTEKYLSLELMQELITIINEKSQSLKYNSKYGTFDDLVYMSKLLNFLNMFSKHSPCALHHIISYDDLPNLHKSPLTTVEMRVFNCPKNGHESYLLNKLIEYRINYLLECQRRKEIINYNPIDPCVYINKKHEVLSKFNQYVTECGLDPNDYQSLLRL